MSENYFEQSPDQLSEFLNFMEEDIENVRRVMRDIRENDIDAEFIVHPKAKTVDQSAENTSMEKSQIVKSLVFKSGEGFVAVLCPGDKRVSEDKLEKVTGGEVRMAKPEEVKKETGYVVGSVSPFDLDMPVYMDDSILKKDKVKPAAGSRVIGIEIEPENLEKIISPEIEDLTV